MNRSVNPTLTEIVRYCREENTFGALLLCGEWGSGKTHLLDVDLPAVLGASYVILRISLFGEESLEGIRRKVQQAFEDRQRELCSPASAPAGSRPAPQVAGRRLILAFDDLERTNLSQVELLGCINEYCENLHIKTIIVANEEKIENRSAPGTGSTDSRKKEYLVYSEMKEKLIERTVRLQMDDAAVIQNIISSYRSESSEYLSFLQENRESLISLLKDCELHNIRSLRCGLQDFERVFLWCREEGIPEEDIRRYFSSFVLFTMLAKNGKISRSSLYGYGLNKLQQKYRGHYEERCMPDCLKDSIMTGDWNEARIREQLRKARDFQRSLAQPENRIRVMNLPELDDDTISTGWLPYLALAFEGSLAPFEYIHLLRHLLTARKYGLLWPPRTGGTVRMAADAPAPDKSSAKAKTSTSAKAKAAARKGSVPESGSLLPAGALAPEEMEHLASGLEHSFEQICRTGEMPAQSSEPLEEEELRLCTDAELALYKQILRCMDHRELVFHASRSQLLAACKSREENALYQCRRCIIRRFDSELVQAVFDCYVTLPDNRRRIAFADLIGKIVSDSRIGHFEEEAGPGRADVPSEGIRSLIRLLQENSQKEMLAGHPLAAMAAVYFSQLLENPAGRNEGRI